MNKHYLEGGGITEQKSLSLFKNISLGNGFFSVLHTILGAPAAVITAH